MKQMRLFFVGRGIQLCTTKSICVRGELAIMYTHTSSVHDDGRPAPLVEFRVGEWVEFEMERGSNQECDEGRSQ